jgi:ankyrin repeat protein
MLREYSVMYYVKKFYGLYNKKKIIVFFDDNGDKCYYDGTINYILQKDEIEKMRKNDYFIFFDNKRTRGTDISLPQCYALCSISIINNSVDVMQGIFRLRKIAKENTHNQTCDFLISDDIKTDVETFSLYTYLNKRTELYIKDQYSELLIQLLNTSIKFKSNTYELKEINQNFIPNFNDSKLENLYVDYDLENKLNVINCNVSNKIIVNYCEEITKLKTRRNINTHELTSISESKQLNSLMQSSTSTQISTQKNISATQIYKEHDYYLHKKRITYPNDIINLYDYDDRKVSLYERYIYSFDYKNIKISQNFVNSIFYSFLIFPKDVELLFENFNIDANKEDDKGKTMLFYTIINKHNYFFDYLLNMQNIDVNKKIDGESYLHLILQYPMKYIQENINITSLTDEIVDRINDDYYSMFLHITKHQNININIKDKHENTPLHTILKNYSEYRNYDYIGNILENKKIHINITDNDGNSCLHIAAKKDFISEIKRFVNIKSINIDQQNKLRETPFHIAIKDNNIELINYFLIFKNKININNVDINNNAILHSIIQNCNEEVLKHVLKYNPKINVRNNNDETPLDLAINTNEEKIALLLLKNDAKFDLKNKNGDTSLHFAIKKNYINL